MLPPADRQFRLPSRSRVPTWLWLAAIALHIPLVLLLVRRELRKAPARYDSHPLVIADSIHAVRLPVLRREIAAPAPTHVASAPRHANVPLTTPTALPPIASIGIPAPATTDAQTPAGATDLRPHYGDGRLWVRPLAESPRVIAKALTGKTDKQLTDSAVAAMVQTYLDAMAAEALANPTSLPSWTTKIGGKTVGLDSKWIYLGPIKIPTMLLALLPINMQGNMSDYQYNKQLASMRADLFDAARRAATYDDFKKAVKDLHEQSEQRREFKKAQATAPDTSHYQ